MMRRILGVGTVTLVLALVGAGCSASAPPKINVPCPYPAGTIQFMGDSLGFALAYNVSADGMFVANRAAGRSGFTYSIPANTAEGLPAVPSIAEQTEKYITQCGDPDLVIIQGGINDLAGVGVSAATLEAAVMELSDWLEAAGIPTLWIAVHPIPRVSNYMWAQPT
jgi:hypothetical protein